MACRRAYNLQVRVRLLRRELGLAIERSRRLEEAIMEVQKDSLAVEPIDAQGGVEADYGNDPARMVRFVKAARRR